MNPRPTPSIEPDGFRMGGEPFRLLGGAMHYFRVRPEYWRDRLTKLVDVGANTVELQIENEYGYGNDRTTCSTCATACSTAA